MPASNQIGEGAESLGRQPAASRPDWLGALIGLATFATGIGLLAFTFGLAYDMFQVPPAVAMSEGTGKSVDLARAGESFAKVLLRVMVLFVMCVVGAVIANRGIRLYISCRYPQPPPTETPEPIAQKEERSESVA